MHLDWCDDKSRQRKVLISFVDIVICGRSWLINGFLKYPKILLLASTNVNKRRIGKVSNGRVMDWMLDASDISITNDFGFRHINNNRIIGGWLKRWAEELYCLI